MSDKKKLYIMVIMVAVLAVAVIVLTVLLLGKGDKAKEGDVSDKSVTTTVTNAVTDIETEVVTVTVTVTDDKGEVVTEVGGEVVTSAVVVNPLAKTTAAKGNTPANTTAAGGNTPGNTPAKTTAAKGNTPANTGYNTIPGRTTAKPSTETPVINEPVQNEVDSMSLREQVQYYNKLQKEISDYLKNKYGNKFANANLSAEDEEMYRKYVTYYQQYMNKKAQLENYDRPAYTDSDNGNETPIFEDGDDGGGEEDNSDDEE